MFDKLSTESKLLHGTACLTTPGYDGRSYISGISSWLLQLTKHMQSCPSAFDHVASCTAELVYESINRPTADVNIVSVCSTTGVSHAIS